MAPHRRHSADPGAPQRSLWQKRSRLGRTTDDIVAAIKKANLLTDWFGNWPDFHDAEVVSLDFGRGNLMQVFETREWSKAVKPTLTAVLYLPGWRGELNAAERKAALVTLKFTGFERFSLDGFNHQNPIVGLEIIWEHSTNLRKDLFAVDWGGTALQHEASFTCEEIEVLSVAAA